MARPYSMDLRQRVIAAVERGGMSRHQAAAHFGVAVSTAITWVKRFRQTGSAAPDRMGGHKPKAIRGAHRDWLIERCAARDFTLRGLVAELTARGLEVGYGAVWNFVHAEKLSFKKNRSRPRAGPSRGGATARAMAAISRSY
jgi:putative transposase